MDNEARENRDLREEAEKENDKGDIFAIEEINVEEMAIDGICGVY